MVWPSGRKNHRLYSLCCCAHKNWLPIQIPDQADLQYSLQPSSDGSCFRMGQKQWGCSSQSLQREANCKPFCIQLLCYLPNHQPTVPTSWCKSWWSSWLCCGQGILEIKCPYKYHECAPADIDDPSFCLVNTADGLKLSSNHQYYTQVQLQLALCEVSYCHFVVWTPKGLVINRIQPDHSYFTEIKPKLDYFFTKFILPELLTRYLQHPSPLISPQDDPPLAPSQENDPLPQNIYCYCRQGEDGRQMIGCDNHNCP